MKRIQCTHCRKVLTLEQILPGKSYSCGKCGELLLKTSRDALVSEVPECPYCGSGIQDGDISVFCPVCGVEYHQECWLESEGCSTYGCSQSGVLKAPPMKITTEMLAAAPVPAPSASQSFPDSIPQPSLARNAGCLGMLVFVLIAILISVGV